jgi:mannitol-specific phosphotransferase system IIBC component
LVKKVAVTYDLSALPPSLILSFNVLRRKLERSGYEIEVVLRPLNGLPPDVDLVFVPEEMQAAAQQAVPGARLMPLVPDASHQPAYDELLQHLEAGQEMCASRRQEGDNATEATRRVIMRYRGHERID